MDSKKDLRNWFREWISGHALWELTSHLVRTVGAAWLGSYAWARLTHAALDTAVNVFLLVLGILGVAWGIGLLPVQRNKTSAGEMRDRLKSKYDALILAWTQLDNLYQNSPKDDHAPKRYQTLWVPNRLAIWTFDIGLAFFRRKHMHYSMI